jgi:hypothetical protein
MTKPPYSNLYLGLTSSYYKYALMWEHAKDRTYFAYES